MKDYCSYFPEEVQNQEIGQSCCKQHDHDVTRTFNLVTPHTKFYRCLRSRNVTWTWAIIITIGGTNIVLPTGVTLATAFTGWIKE